MLSPSQPPCPHSSNSLTPLIHLSLSKNEVSPVTGSVRITTRLSACVTAVSHGCHTWSSTVLFTHTQGRLPLAKPVFFTSPLLDPLTPLTHPCLHSIIFPSFHLPLLLSFPLFLFLLSHSSSLPLNLNPSCLPGETTFFSPPLVALTDPCPLVFCFLSCPLSCLSLVSLPELLLFKCWLFFFHLFLISFYLVHVPDFSSLRPFWPLVLINHSFFKFFTVKSALLNQQKPFNKGQDGEHRSRSIKPKHRTWRVKLDFLSPNAGPGRKLQRKPAEFH